MWGVNIPVMKFGVGQMDRLAFNALRLSLSAVVLGLLVLLENRRVREGAPWGRILVVLGGFIYQVAFVLGIRKTLAGNTALILSTTPMWTALIAWLVGMERLRGLAWIGLCFTCCGAALVTFDPAQLDLGSRHLQGNLLILGASGLWAWSSVLSKPLFDHITPTRLAFLAAAITLPAHFALAGRATGTAISTICTDSAALGSVVYSGLFSTGFAYALWNFGVRKVGPSHASIYANVVPIVALFCGWIALHETIGGMQIPGGLLILGGLLCMRRSR